MDLNGKLIYFLHVGTIIIVIEALKWILAVADPEISKGGHPQLHPRNSKKY
jgi:hypothetical protein